MLGILVSLVKLMGMAEVVPGLALWSFALLIVGVHDSIDQSLVVGKHPGGAQHGIHQSGLAMVDVRDQRDVAKGSDGHESNMVGIKSAYRHPGRRMLSGWTPNQQPP